MRPQAILPDALSAVGETPLIQLNRIPHAEGIKCNVMVKCEYFNAGGSVKDRIARRMLLQAEQDGTLIRASRSSSNPPAATPASASPSPAPSAATDASSSSPRKMSAEKVNTLRALGAEVIRTPTEAAHDDPRSNIMVARRLQKSIPDAVILDQYNNPNNPTAHWATAEEIIEAIKAGPAPPSSTSLLHGMGSLSLTAGKDEPLDASANARPLTPDSNRGADEPNGSTHTYSDKVDVLVAGVGTGGTISGIASRLKRADHNPDCYVLGVDPIGSTLALPPRSTRCRGLRRLVQGGGHRLRL